MTGQQYVELVNLPIHPKCALAVVECLIYPKEFKDVLFVAQLRIGP